MLRQLSRAPTYFSGSGRSKAVLNRVPFYLWVVRSLALADTSGFSGQRQPSDTCCEFLVLPPWRSEHLCL
jgi:hypothetical protein